MEGILREYEEQDLGQMTEIWNAVVRDGDAFPQTEELNEESAREFFSSQTCTGVFEEGGEVLGLYILHPNNIGRCGHICNASFAVKKGAEGARSGKSWCATACKRQSARVSASFSSTPSSASTKPRSAFMSAWALPGWAGSKRLFAAGRNVCGHFSFLYRACPALPRGKRLPGPGA